MKKIFSVLLILSLAFCMVACGEKDLPAEDEINLLDKVESGEENKKEIIKYFDVEKIDQYAQTQVIKLPEDPSTGYEWVYIIDDAEVMNVVRDVFVDGYRECEIKGLTAGETIIYFDSINDLESGEEIKENIKFYISVNENNEIAVTDELH